MKTNQERTNEATGEVLQAVERIFHERSLANHLEAVLINGYDALSYNIGMAEDRDYKPSTTYSVSEGDLDHLFGSVQLALSLANLDEKYSRLTRLSKEQSIEKEVSNGR